ncbi:ABC-three component system middle component 1 [Dickeya lacustris]|uniref:Uncharacterized protein n=1 Tax=Dickeya lacustris TaxID=2259638 RepID=A0ABY8GBQ1_9GAMM|nr:ABC-three component system middle component 1 [Dickeya lacustris]WFN57298.1 hypothetical protein O1Q98_08935 [Dickeya lacustris]
MIIEIIENIFLSNQYKRLEFNTSHSNELFYIFYPEESTEREEYFVLLQSLNQSNDEMKLILEEKAQLLFEEIIGSDKVERFFEKNCTLIICQNDNDIDRLTALRIEEDLYNFKKNVIAYTDSELEDLVKYLEVRSINKLSNRVLNDVINEHDGESFISFKNSSVNASNYYSLIVKLFLKLPFLTYSIEEKELIDLNGEIENKLTQHQKYIFKKLISNESEWTDNNIHDLVVVTWGKQGD